MGRYAIIDTTEYAGQGEDTAIVTFDGPLITLEERGNIRVGNYADLVLFDPGTVEDRSTMLDPTALSVGIEKVWVNGVLAFEDGESTGVYPGHVVGRGKP